VIEILVLLISLVLGGFEISFIAYPAFFLLLTGMEKQKRIGYIGLVIEDRVLVGAEIRGMYIHVYCSFACHDVNANIIQPVGINCGGGVECGVRWGDVRNYPDVTACVTNRMWYNHDGANQREGGGNRNSTLYIPTYRSDLMGQIECRWREMMNCSTYVYFDPNAARCGWGYCGKVVGWICGVMKCMFCMYRVKGRVGFTSGLNACGLLGKGRLSAGNWSC